MPASTIQTVEAFDAARPPGEGRPFVAVQLHPEVPDGHHLVNYIYTRHPVGYPARLCLLNAPDSGYAATEVRKYHHKVEVEWRRVLRVQRPT